MLTTGNRAKPTVERRSCIGAAPASPALAACRDGAHRGYVSGVLRAGRAEPGSTIDTESRRHCIAPIDQGGTSGSQAGRMRFLWSIRRGVGGSRRHRSAARGAARAGARAGQVLLPGLLVRGRGLMAGGHPLLEEVNPAELALELDGPTPPVLVDVRTAEERAIATIEPSLHLDLGEFVAQAAMWLKVNGWSRPRNLAGGIDEWSLVVDPRIPRY